MEACLVVRGLEVGESEVLLVLELPSFFGVDLAGVDQVAVEEELDAGLD